jgi:predicted  nucleic acid-binding Zn-ribbon protein
MHKRIIFIMAAIFVLFYSSNLIASDNAKEKVPAQTASEKNNDKASKPDIEKDQYKDSIRMLMSIIDLKKNLETRIKEKKVALKKSTSDAEQVDLKDELEKLDRQLSQANSDFERTATGIDISLFDEKEDVPFNWKDELISLIKPGIVELKHLTVKARYKSQLQEELASYQNLHPMSKQAFENLNNMISKTKDKIVKKSLKRLVPEWKSVESQISNRMEIIQMELDKIETEKESLMEAMQQSVKNFFKTRGLFLIIAIIACAGLVMLLRLLYLTLMKVLPDYSTQYRPFHIRVIDLLFKIVTLILSLIILVLVFYIFEDWVLLSLSLIVLLGLGWTVKSTLPKYWAQSRLMLNIGAVREGERIILDGIPWLVKNISMFSKLENPDLGIKLRVPIEVLMDKSSR